MGSKTRMRNVAALVFVAGLSTATWALAQAPAPHASGPEASSMQDARARFKRGLALYANGSFDAALAEFKRAYGLAPSYRILYNIAQASCQTHDYAGALESFELYLTGGGAEIEAKRRAEVNSELQKLRPRVATIRTSTSVMEAQILVDDVVVGIAPLPRPLFVNAGKRRLSAVKNGIEVASRVVEVAGGDAIHVALEPSASPLPSASHSASPDATVPAVVPQPRERRIPIAAQPKASADARRASPNRPAPSSSSLLWAGWTTTGALAAGAIVTGVMATKASGELKDLQDSPTATLGELQDASSRTRRFALATDLLGAATLVAGGISIYLTVRPRASNDSAAPAVVSFVVSPAALSLTAGF